jgi:hypothetical protein
MPHLQQSKAFGQWKVAVGKQRAESVAISVCTAGEDEANGGQDLAGGDAWHCWTQSYISLYIRLATTRRPNQLLEIPGPISLQRRSPVLLRGSTCMVTSRPASLLRRSLVLQRDPAHVVTSAPAFLLRRALVLPRGPTLVVT